MTIEKLQKKFPSYMEHITLPECAIEQSIPVYRACKTRKIERESFLNTYEENGFQVLPDGDPADPQQYCLSTCENLKDIKRFVTVSWKYNPPWVLAKGVTEQRCGVSCRSKEWKRTKSSHVDWWLYEGAEPWKFFEEVEYEAERQRAIYNQ